MIRRIAVGSRRNKLLFILPAALLLSELATWLLTPLLMARPTNPRAARSRGGHAFNRAARR